MNRGDGLFCDGSRQAGPAITARSAARGLAVGDLFNDGAVDAVVENLDGSPSLLRNGGVRGAHSIEFEVTGTHSNRSAIGAEITVQTGAVRQSAEIRSGGSYLSQSDLRAHFGLAAASAVDRVEIRWPSGLRQALIHLTADRIYSVLEGQGVVSAIRPHGPGANPS